MGLEIIIAGIMLLALIIYTVSGGADFGGGVWDLLATGPRAKSQRTLIAHAIGPTWEANHVWLILVIVLLFVGFPKAFAAISTALHIPLTLMLIGVVLRGSAFVFRAYGNADETEQRRWGQAFAIASVYTPVMLGIVIGAVVSGTLRMDPATGLVVTDFFSSWLAPLPFAMGFFTLALFAYLAAVYLTLETEEVELQNDFRQRALASGVVLGVAALITAFLARAGAPLIWEGLTERWWSIPFHATTGLMATGALYALWSRRYALARGLAATQAAMIILGWGLAQFPYIIIPDLTFQATAAPESVLGPVLIALVVGALLLIPSFVYLYAIFKGRTLLGNPSVDKAHSDGG